MKKLPKVSFVICTLDCKDYTERCLKSIREQDYPQDKVEIVMVDSYSTDGTIEVGKKYGANVILSKIRGYMEGKGMPKSIGCENAKGEIIITIDSDNKLVEKDWIRKMIKPLIEDKNITYAVSRMAIARSDPLINQYLSYVGTDPFAVYSSLDPQVSLGNIKMEDRGDYFVYNNNRKNFLITGGYYLAFRKKTLKEIGGYSRDVDVAYKLANREGGANIAIVKVHLHHLITTSTINFVKKKVKWAKYFFNNPEVDRDFEWSSGIFGKHGRIRFVYEVLISLLFIPAFFTALRMYFIYGDKAWLIHPFIKWATTAAYIFAFFRTKF